MSPKPSAEFQSPFPERCLYDHTSPCHPKPCFTETMRSVGTHLGEMQASDNYDHETRETAILTMRELMNCAVSKMPLLQEQVAAAKEQHQKNRRR